MPKRKTTSGALDDAGRVRYLATDWPPRADLDGFTELTSAEREVAALAITGLSAKVIGAQRACAERTVHNHLQRVYRKLGVCSRQELALLVAEAYATHGGA